MKAKGRRSLLRASIGVATVTYVVGIAACHKDPPTGNVVAPPPTDQPPVVGNLPAPPEPAPDAALVTPPPEDEAATNAAVDAGAPSKDAGSARKTVGKKLVPKPPRPPITGNLPAPPLRTPKPVAPNLQKK